MAFKDKNLKKLADIDASKYSSNKALKDEIESIQKDLAYYQEQDFTEEEVLEVLDDNHTLLLEKIAEADKPTPKPKKAATQPKIKKVDRAKLVATDVTSCRRVINLYERKKRQEKIEELKANALANAKTSKEKKEIEARDSIKDFEPKKTVPEVVEQRLENIIEYVIQQRALTFGTEKKLRKKALKSVKDKEMKKVVNGIKQLILNESREAYTEIISKVI
ncbi:hypothetical protein [uncultured Microscilla sp.]|uniref:hypothetical protein n=1 Tax=uncultured Microscilla sp. TaxID=432653 RepID=UPI002633D76F|nr:hypothetical protein [uncultured Microscilla sp.]